MLVGVDSSVQSLSKHDLAVCREEKKHHHPNHRQFPNLTSAITSALCGVDQAGALHQRGHSCLLLLLSCFHLVLKFVFFSAIMQNLLRLQSCKICVIVVQ